jgi:EAL domain-containing protein (putative c-di-GMP-specific phosphodiesterase class I)
MPQDRTQSHGCLGCKDGAFALPFSMAFQPIVDLADGSVFAFEALVRGPAGEGAMSVLDKVDDATRYGFDQACRTKAISMSADLGLLDGAASLSINFLPNAVYEPRACIRATVAAAHAASMPLDRIIFEITENERVVDPGHLTRIVETYKGMGLRTAIDDFGAGYSNLTLLTRFQPDILKLDMDLVRGVDRDRIRRGLIRSIVAVCRDLGITLVAEGVETADERDALLDLGVSIQQGYLFAKPGFESLPEPGAMHSGGVFNALQRALI